MAPIGKQEEQRYIFYDEKLNVCEQIEWKIMFEQRWMLNRADKFFGGNAVFIVS